MHAILSATATFADAAEQWLDSRRFITQNKKAQYISPRTLHDYEAYVRTLGKFFGLLRLCDIHVGNLRQYQIERSSTAGANKIESELSILRRIMKRANCWSDELDECHEPLQHEELDIPRALTPVEQALLLETAASREGWQVVYWYCLLALRTTASNCEMRGLKVGDINLIDRYLMIRRAHAKNKHRIRTIPLTAEAPWACQMLLDRAKELGSALPEHYLFPFRTVRNEWNPEKPMSSSGIKKPFDEVRRAAGLPRLRFHDLRHSAITRLAECGTPIPVIMSLAGHISQRMMQHYTQISDQAKRAALELANGKKPTIIAPKSNVQVMPSPPKKQPSRGVPFVVAWKSVQNGDIT
jgi:integrase